ncbi:MAG: hypothetical protein LBL86_12750 [Coriobacteriales bacterium]|jgi:hypothetical protein|nr:hypothetical protein [Coriobacteriales bacterium]
MRDESFWYDSADPDNIREITMQGDALLFTYQNRDYFVERGASGFLIQNPHIGSDGLVRNDVPYANYPGHEDAKTPEGFMALPFLDGKTLFERFDELCFFEV